MSKNRLNPTLPVSLSALSLLSFTYLAYLVCVIKPSEYDVYESIARSPEGWGYFSTGAVLAFWMGRLFLMLDIFSLSSTQQMSPPVIVTIRNAPTHFQMLPGRVGLAWVQHRSFYTLSKRDTKGSQAIL